MSLLPSTTAENVIRIRNQFFSHAATSNQKHTIMQPYVSIVLSTTLKIMACIRNHLSRILQLPMRSTQSCGFRYCTREWLEMSYNEPLGQSYCPLISNTEHDQLNYRKAYISLIPSIAAENATHKRNQFVSLIAITNQNAHIHAAFDSVPEDNWMSYRNHIWV